MRSPSHCKTAPSGGALRLRDDRQRAVTVYCRLKVEPDHPVTYQEDGSRAEAPSNDAPPRPVPKPLGIMVYVTFDLVEPGRIVHPVYKGISAAGKGRW